MLIADRVLGSIYTYLQEDIILQPFSHIYMNSFDLALLHGQIMSRKQPSSGPFPTAHSTKSFWRSSIKPIDQHRTTESLPSNADIVIIGAGYSGAAIAHHLIEESKRLDRAIPSIVILEAREVCSGATGRNGMLCEDTHEVALHV